MSPSYSTSISIALTNASVRYRIPTEDIGTLKEHFIRLLHGRRIHYRNFWALKGIDLQVAEGEALGIIGRNGAGKSTLLKVISKILRPTLGRALVKGKVAPLIELGAGFHPELTGRENIYLNGSMLGFSKQYMDEKAGRIIGFAGLEDFIDAPLRTYSSGMIMRLGFSIATDVEPDILIIDEILAVGDEEFQQKCHHRMEQFRSSGTTILFVSHSLSNVQRICDRSCWIDNGKVKELGPSEEVVASYRSTINQ